MMGCTKTQLLFGLFLCLGLLILYFQLKLIGNTMELNLKSDHYRYDRFNLNSISIKLRDIVIYFLDFI